MSALDTFMNFDQESRIKKLETQVRELQRTVGKMGEWIHYLNGKISKESKKNGQSDTDTI